MEQAYEDFVTMEVLVDVSIILKDMDIINDLRMQISQIIREKTKPVLTTAESQIIENYFQLDCKLGIFIILQNKGGYRPN